MVHAFTIRNFRSFKDVTVEDCRRVNLLVGDNGSGKTALLEALFLAAGVSPEIAVRTRSWRGQEGAQLSGSYEDLHDALWSDLFYRFETGRPAFVKLEGTGEENRSVTVTLNKRGKLRVVPPNRKRPGTLPRTVPVSADKPIEFRWSITRFGDFSVEPRFEESKLVFPPVPAEPIRASFFAANRTPPLRESVARFSTLSQSFKERPFIEKFKKVFPKINDLSLESTGGGAVIYASVAGLPRKIPLGIASGGMSKLIAILLAMTGQADGIVLIDEIENGFYHSHMPIIWEMLLEFAMEYNCQLFVSTHSAECLTAAAALAEKYSGDFSMLRAVNSTEGTIVRHFEGDRFAHAVLDKVEVR